VKFNFILCQAPSFYISSAKQKSQIPSSAKDIAQVAKLVDRMPQLKKQRIWRELASAIVCLSITMLKSYINTIFYF
jgi:hypothetical protein